MSWSEYSSLIMAAIVLIVVLVVIYIALQYYYLKHPDAGTPSTKAGFAGTSYYAPACGSMSQGRNRAYCKGPSAGIMPSIEYPYRCGGDLGCGLLGVPP